ncbi:DUF1330 domain-containing protein [Thiosulfatihalobacter marinus]|uniref:DUF1330 domain-containing protein n=1 Tax=Thiosulfatihalobacter marinus TaxID=2792481 RepID=UPI0018DA176C|nr:DUF1330 domain-containing protein [Thiosulfatihalobacter marinus]
MTVYVIGQLDIHDPERYRAYLDGFMPSFSRHGGTLLATSAAETTVLEGSWAFPKTVIMAFPDKASAQAWHSDPEYVELARIRHQTARTNLVIVEGISPVRPEG